MEGYSSPPPSRGSHAAIEHLLRTNAPFAQIEGAIERMDLTPDEKASGTKIMPCVSRFEGNNLVLEL